MELIETFGPSNGRTVTVHRDPSRRIGDQFAFVVSLREPHRAEDWHAPDELTAHLRARRAFATGRIIGATG